MRVKIYVNKKAGLDLRLAADIDPSLFGLQETLAEVVSKATFHEWYRVSMVFDYEEKKLRGVGSFIGIPADSAHDMTPAPAAGSETHTEETK